MVKNILFVWMLLTGISCFAKVPLPQKHTYVNDFAHVLTKKQIQYLNKQIRAFENKTTVQLAVVIVNKVPAEYTIEDYALLIGRKWHVGVADNGLVYVAAIGQRKQRLEIADSLQKYIPDAKASSILNLVKIDLKYASYAEAIKTLITEVDNSIAQAKTDIANDRLQTAKAKKEEIASARIKKIEDKKAGNIITILFWIIGVLLLGKPAFYLIIVILRFLFPSTFRQVDTASVVNNGSSNSPRRLIINNVINSTTVITKRYQRSETVIERPRHRQENPQSTDSGPNDETQYGKWGDDNNRNTSSSSNSGFNGGGATSDW